MQYIFKLQVQGYLQLIINQSKKYAYLAAMKFKYSIIA